MKKTIKLTETQLKKLFIQTLSEEKNKKSKKCEITIEVPESICDICRESGMSNEEICDIYKDFVMNCIGADEDNEQEMFMSWAEENGLIDDEGEEDDEEDDDEGEEDDEEDDDEGDDDDEDEEEEEDFLDDFEDDEEEDEEDDEEDDDF